MQIGRLPPLGRIISRASGNPDIELRSELPDILQDRLVELFIGDSAFSPSLGPFGYLLVPVVQPKRHGPQHDVQALSENVIVRSNLRNIFRVYGESGSADGGVVL